MHLEEIRHQLESLDVIRGVPVAVRPRVVYLFLGIAKEEIHYDGETLFEHGAPNDGTAYILVRGRLEVTKPDSPMVEVEAPHLIGELAQLNKKQQRGATVRAQGESVLLHFTWAAFAEAARSVLTAEEAQAVQESLERLAWEHLSN